ncbi:MAG: ABC transporter permease [Muribaculaceae bacterium]|jgi:ABC-2 type transport system permease protein|nr:ABC transporter permease [Muribaculaceae bacterium]
MSVNKTSIIISREYSERVKKKSFIITTILVPVLMLALSVLPTLIIVFAGSGETKTVAVIDDSGLILQNLTDNEEVRYIAAEGTQEELLSADEIYGLLVIDRNIVKRPSGVKLLTPNASSLAVENNITSQMEKIIETEKLKSYDIDNLDQILDNVKTSVTLQTLRTDENGEEGESQSAAISSAIGTLLNFLLYMFLVLYGSLVMNSIIEEKNNRVLEIVVSSIKPTQLLIGKIIGVGLVAVTQIIIWVAIVLCITTMILPAVMPADIMNEVTALNAGSMDISNSSIDQDMAIALGMFTNVGYVLELVGYLFLFLVGGFLFYASIFAMIGSAVDNIQDASQLQMLGIVPVIIGLVSSMAVIPNPNGLFAIIMSMIPFTSPMVMMARVPFDIPAWQIVVSIVLLYLSIFFMVWIAAKIYRIGIFMYGKKPTVRDLIRWARYK